jgi:hypothetical protein
MTKLKPLDKFEKDVKEGDLVRIVFTESILVGFFVTSTPSCNGYYSVTLGRMLNINKKNQNADPRSYVWGGETDESTPDPLGYEVLKRRETATKYNVPVYSHKLPSKRLSKSEKLEMWVREQHEKLAQAEEERQQIIYDDWYRRHRDDSFTGDS